MSLKNKNITVLGAGIGGLTAAIALARRGARVSVIEQARELSEIGAGLQLSPNGTAVLNALDLGQRLGRISTPLEAVELRDYRRGDPVVSMDMTRAHHANPYLLVHRADLVEMLAASAKRHGVALLFGKKVTGVAIGFDQATLPVENGPQRTTKILVAADGVHSLARQTIDRRDRPEFTGQIAWRATIEARFLPAFNIPARATIWMGPGRHLVTYPLRGGALINVVAVEERKDWVEEGWNRLDDPENLRRAFSGFAPEVRRLLSICEDVYLWGLFAHPVSRSWSQGVAVMLGDAVHPTLPFWAQGANMALEDAWVLAHEMDRHDDLQNAYAAYRKRRYQRVRRIVNAARKNARNYHLASPAVRFAAHTVLRFAGGVAP
ncbi:MAG: FAD-dependent monooxygenase, partial [Paracoccaceae bacterium]